MGEYLRILIVDDERLARERARRMLESIGGVEIVGEACDAADARRQLESVRPDLLLLDIQMPGEDGFTVLEGVERRPAVVFITAYEQYAVRAFEQNAVDYLLKPFRKERLEQALQRARADLARPDELAARLQALLGSLERGAGGPTLDRFTVRVGQRQLILSAIDVKWFAAEDKLVYAATASGRHYVNFTLDQLERRLDGKRFFRIHRGFIANLDLAAGLRPAFAGTWRLQLRDEEKSELPVSRARARLLKERLGA